MKNNATKGDVMAWSLIACAAGTNAGFASALWFIFLAALVMWWSTCD